MKELNKAICEIDEAIALEGKRPLDTLGSYILGAVLRYTNNDVDVDVGCAAIMERIGDYASDLEIKNGDDAVLREEWEALKRMVDRLKSLIQ